MCAMVCGISWHMLVKLRSTPQITIRMRGIYDYILGFTYVGIAISNISSENRLTTYRSSAAKVKAQWVIYNVSTTSARESISKCDASFSGQLPNPALFDILSHCVI